jgi:hypothetical protein
MYETTTSPLAFPNEDIPMARKLELARKAAGFKVQELDRVLGVTRNCVSDYQRPGKIKNYDLHKVLMWCLACEVRPSWISPEYEMHDTAVEAKILALREKGISFAEEHIGYDPRETDAPVGEDEEDALPFFLRVNRDGTHQSLDFMEWRLEYDDGAGYPEVGILPAGDELN